MTSQNKMEEYKNSKTWQCDESPTGAHHWVIEKPNGRTSLGRCKYCGEKRDWVNSYTYSSWHAEIRDRKNRKQNAAKRSDLARTYGGRRK